MILDCHRERPEARGSAGGLVAQDHSICKKWRMGCLGTRGKVSLARTDVQDSPESLLNVQILFAFRSEDVPCSQRSSQT